MYSEGKVIEFSVMADVPCKFFNAISHRSGLESRRNGKTCVFR